MLTDEENFMNLLKHLGEMTSKDPSEGVLKLYYKLLEPLGIKKVNKALENMFESVKRFPTIEEIKEAMGIFPKEVLSAEDMAQETISKIPMAVSKFGWMQGAKAKEWLGDTGWAIVERMGGWGRLCEMETKQMGIFMAQSRDLATSLHRLAMHDIVDPKFKLSPNKDEELDKPEAPKKITGKKDDDAL